MTSTPLKMWLDTATNVDGVLSAVLGDASDTDVDLECGRDVCNGFSNWDNESLFLFCLSNLAFPWLLMKVLLTVILNFQRNNMAEVMFILYTAVTCSYSNLSIIVFIILVVEVMVERKIIKMMMIIRLLL